MKENNNFFLCKVWFFLFVSLVGSIIATSGLDWLYFRIKRENQIAGQRPNSRLFSSFIIQYSVYTVGIMTSHG